MISKCVPDELLLLIFCNLSRRWFQRFISQLDPSDKVLLGLVYDKSLPFNQHFKFSPLHHHLLSLATSADTSTDVICTDVIMDVISNQQYISYITPPLSPPLLSLSSSLIFHSQITNLDLSGMAPRKNSRVRLVDETLSAMIRTLSKSLHRINLSNTANSNLTNSSLSYLSSSTCPFLNHIGFTQILISPKERKYTWCILEKWILSERISYIDISYSFTFIHTEKLEQVCLEREGTVDMKVDLRGCVLSLPFSSVYKVSKPREFIIKGKSGSKTTLIW